MSVVSPGTSEVDLRTTPAVVGLGDPLALDASVSGAKAANVARLAALGLPVLEGFVLTTAGVALGSDEPTVHAALRERWRLLGGELSTPLVVRSSSTVEDARSSSMAGRFTSVLDVRGWEAFATALSTVVESGRHVDERAPIAVLVQRQLAARVGGVLFGVDPVEGRIDRVVVEWVDGRPDRLVSGRTTAFHAVLSRSGRLLDRHRVAPPVGHAGAPSSATTDLPRDLRRRLARLSALTASAFGGPQDIEWALDLDGGLWVLQARPVTALHPLPPPADRRRLGQGPLTETFPHPLRRLEADLWTAPLREGLRRALRATGAVHERDLRRSDLVTVVADRMVVDLDLIEGGRPRGWRGWMSPRVIAHRLTTAWRVGRLRAALPALASIVVQSADEHLGRVGRIGSHPEADLVGLLRRSRDELATVHSYEILAGMLLPQEDTLPATMIAWRALHDARRDGVPEDELVAVAPAVLALSAPSVDAPESLPEGDIPDSFMAPEGSTVDDLSFRDALRLRVRWLHELQCRAAREIGHRAEMLGALPSASSIALLSLDEVDELGRSGSAPADVAGRRPPVDGPSLPPQFVLALDGTVVPVTARRHGRGDGLGAGGGRGAGMVIDATQLRVLLAAGDTGRPTTGRGATPPVLVTEFLEPSLAPLLPMLGGLIAESGSVLSHLAILARECGVPTVVAVADARRRFPPGTLVTVDGVTGEVSVDEPAVPDAPAPRPGRVDAADRTPS